MGRNIITKPSPEALEGNESAKAIVPDNYTSQIVKLIPVEIVGVYLGIQNIFSTLPEHARFVTQGIIFLIILAISGPYLRIVAEVADKKQRTISIISYSIWCISLGGPFAYLLTCLHSVVTAEQIGGALIMLYTLIVPMLYKITFSTSKPPQ